MYLYVVGTCIPVEVHDFIQLHSVTKHVSRTVTVFEYQFSRFVSLVSVYELWTACHYPTMICCTGPNLSGVTSSHQLLWRLPKNEVVFYFEARHTPAVEPPPLNFPYLIERLSVLDGSGSLNGGELQINNYIAYLLPHIPCYQQLEFVVTRIIGFNVCKPCFVVLENGHHESYCASGTFQCALFDMVSKRVVFPVRNLSSFKIRH